MSKPRTARRLAQLVILVSAFSAGSSFGQSAEPPVGRSIEASARIGFDLDAATRVYLARLPPEQKARSDAYFEGGYWLMLWNFLIGAAISLLLLVTRLSARLRDRAERLIRFKPIQTGTYWALYLVVTTILGFPLTLYEQFFREHQYGLSNQTFGAWFGDQAKGFLVALILGGILVPLLYGVVRRVGRSWWIWGTAVTMVFLAFVLLIAPVLIAPLFNKYTPLEDERIREPILRIARANGIHAKEIYQVDASRQSKRISANVSGFLGTERISLNDNLLKKCSLPEIEAVMGHEMGHYVLNHIYKALIFFVLVVAAAFAWLNWAFHRAFRRWGEKWGIRGIGDVAGLPLAVLVASIFFFVSSPILKTFIRTEEYEADLFGLNASRQPDGFAEVALKLSEYRKLDPGPIEEWIFYDHPSGRVRIFTAMRWKAENLPR